MTKSTQNNTLQKKPNKTAHNKKTDNEKEMASMAIFRRPLFPLLFLEGGVCHDALT